MILFGDRVQCCWSRERMGGTSRKSAEDMNGWVGNTGSCLGRQALCCSFSALVILQRSFLDDRSLRSEVLHVLLWFEVLYLSSRPRRFPI